jgi:hypothetical protein
MKKAFRYGNHIATALFLMNFRIITSHHFTISQLADKLYEVFPVLCGMIRNPRLEDLERVAEAIILEIMREHHGRGLKEGALF